MQSVCVFECGSSSTNTARGHARHAHGAELSTRRASAVRCTTHELQRSDAEQLAAFEPRGRAATNAGESTEGDGDDDGRAVQSAEGTWCTKERTKANWIQITRLACEKKPLQGLCEHSQRRRRLIAQQNLKISESSENRKAWVNFVIL